MNDKWRTIRLGLWNLAAAVSIGITIYYHHQGNTAESTWWNVMAFGTLMLVRTEKEEA